MTDAAVPSASNTLTRQAASSPAPDASAGGLTFHELLSDLNPLQYLPVVGTIYRAVTGDTIPKPLREAGSVVVSGLLSGPIGIGISLGTLAFQKLTGIDFEDLEQSLVAALRGPSHVALAAQDPAPAALPETPAHVGAWTSAQLSAYGVVTLSDGTLRQGELSGSDVLNALQLGEGAPRTAFA